MTFKLEWQKELDRRKEQDITDLPDPLPHPDQIKIDMREGTVKIVGPTTPEEKAMVDEWLEQKALISENVEHLRLAIVDEADSNERADLQKHIDLGETLLAQLRRAIPD